MIFLLLVQSVAKQLSEIKYKGAMASKIKDHNCLKKFTCQKDDKYL